LVFFVKKSICEVQVACKKKDKFQPRYTLVSGAADATVGCSEGAVVAVPWTGCCCWSCGAGVGGLFAEGGAAPKAAGRGGTTTGFRRPGWAGLSKNKPLPPSRRPGVKATWVAAGVCSVWLAKAAGICELVGVCDWYAPGAFACGRLTGKGAWALETGGT